MMTRVLYLTPSFHKALQKLDRRQRETTANAVERFYEFLQTGHLTKGLGFKKLAPGIFEVRVDIHLRIVGVIEQDRYYLYAVGSHDAIRRFLRRQ